MKRAWMLIPLMQAIAWGSCAEVGGDFSHHTFLAGVCAFAASVTGIIVIAKFSEWAGGA